MVKIPTTDHNPYDRSKSLLKFFSLNCTSHNPYSLKWVSRTQLKSLRTQLKSLQTQLKSLQTQLKSLQTQLKSLQTQLKSLQRAVKIPTQSSKSLRSQLSKSCSIKIPTSRDFDWSISVFCETIANPHLPPYFGTLDYLSLGHLLPRHLPLNYGKDKVCLQTSQELRMLSSVTINCQVTKIVNFQNCTQCLKCHKSLGLLLGGVLMYLSLSLSLSLSIFLGHVMSPHHSEQISQRSQVSRIALRRCSQNVWLLVVSEGPRDKVTYWAVLDS